MNNLNESKIVQEEYELIYIIPYNKLEEQDEVVLKVKEIIKRNGGKLLRESEPQKRKLSYPIKKNRNGIYFIYRVLVPKNKINILAEEIRLVEHIIRRFVIVTDKLPSPKDKAEEVRKLKNPQGKPTSNINTEAKADDTTLLNQLSTKKEEPVKKTKDKLKVKEKESKQKVKVVKEEKEEKNTEKIKPVRKAKTMKKKKGEEKLEVKEEEKQEKEKKNKKGKLKLEELDKKIDDILNNDIF